MANFFDQFDEAGNFFDQFDSPKARQTPTAPVAPERGAPPERPRGFGAATAPAEARAPAPPPVDDYVPDVPFDPRALPRPGQTGPQTRTPPQPDPFEGESFGDLASRRGQQAARGATEVFASVPEAGAIIGESADLGRREASADEILDRQQTIDGIRERLKEPGLSEDVRAFLQRNLADLEQGQKELTRRAEAEVVPAPLRQGFDTGQRIRSWTEDTFGAPDPRDTSFWGKLFEGGGNMLGFVATALAGAPLGPAGALASGGVVGASLNSSQIYKEAIASGATQEDALRAARMGGLLGATEAVPITRAMMVLPPRLRGEVSNRFVRRLAQIGMAGGEEAVQEAIVGIGNNMIAQGVYDPERGTFEDVGEQALIGFILGGAVNVGGQAVDAAVGDRTIGGAGPQQPPTPPGQDKPPEAPTAERPVRRPDLLTPEDRASPLPDDAISAGKEILESVEQGRPLPRRPDTTDETAAAPVEAEDPGRYEILPVTDREGNETGEFVRFDSQTGDVTPYTQQETAPRAQATPSVPPVPSAPAQQGFGVATEWNVEAPATAAEITRAEEALKVPKPTERKPEGLMTFIIRQGGIWSGDANIGDVRQLDYRRPGLVKTQRMATSTAGDNNGGLTLDEMRERAVEEGFLSPDSTTADLLDLMDQDVRGERVVRQSDLGVQQQWDAFEGRGNPDPEDLALEMRRQDQRDAAEYKQNEPLPPLDVADLNLVPLDAPDARTSADQARGNVQAVFRKMRVEDALTVREAEAIIAAHAESGEDIEFLVEQTLTRGTSNAKARDEDLADLEDIPFFDSEDPQAADARGPRSDGDGDAADRRVDEDERPAEVGSQADAETDRRDPERTPQARSGTREGGRVDVTPEGDQTVIPGAEQIPDRERAERQMQQPRQGGNAPPPEGGLFGDPMNRRDLFDEISAAAAQADPNPTDAQKAAGNYKLGHVAWKGLDISIENAKGSERTGTDSDGETWSVTMPAHYGYIKRSTGADGEHVDVYLGDNPDSDLVFVVDQVDAETGAFDEHKLLLGFTSLKQATDTYDAGFSDGRGPDRRGAVTGTSVDEIKAWLTDGDTSQPWAPTKAAGERSDLTADDNPGPLVIDNRQDKARPTSWFVIRRENGELIGEWQDSTTIDQMAPDFAVVDAETYLGAINAAISENGGTDQGLDLDAVRLGLVQTEPAAAPSPAATEPERGEPVPATPEGGGPGSAAPQLNPAFATSRDPLRKPGDWQEGTLSAENPDGTTEEVEAGEAVRSLMARYRKAQKLMECLNA